MTPYLDTLKAAIIVFPFIALFITTPFWIIQYHRFGSISFLKSFILYSFVLYFICAYFMVILPLPEMSAVTDMSNPTMQLIPFKFVKDFLEETPLILGDISTYKAAIFHASFFVPMYNFLLTLPFGAYLTYYYRFSALKVGISAFLLSLFYELTQLSGLYFIYPRSYRLFDVDDLMVNTVGGLLGYLLFKRIVKHLPQREAINEKAKLHSRSISGLRRTLSIICDGVIWVILEISAYTAALRLNLEIRKLYIALAIMIIYFVFLPCILRNATIGQWLVRLRAVDKNNKTNPVKLIIRRIIFLVIYVFVPLALIYSGVYYFRGDYPRILSLAILGITLGISFLIYAISGLKYLFTGKPLLYEKISGTKLISTIKVE